MASGAAVDTSTLGLKDFIVVARDKAGNESMQTVQYEVIAPTNVTVAGTIKDIEGNVLPGSTVRALMAGTSTVVASTEANVNGVYSLTLPAGTYDLRYRSHSGTLLGADLAERTYLQDKTVNVVLGPIDPDPVVLSGTITTGSGSPLCSTHT
ncbi:MAG: carboxypeptidase-like regulatory domain-containing protein [Candidatus Nanopelagicales bacterium]